MKNERLHLYHIDLTQTKASDETPDKMKNLTKRCCDFRKLEKIMEKEK